MSYTRQTILEMAGYTPGEQPRDRLLVKLNTNENPYPPSPAVTEALASLTTAGLRLYPDPLARALRQEAARQWNLSEDAVICGNGSDDLLTIGVRTFVDQGGTIACPDPTYSLYPVLARIQGARTIHIPLDETFNPPPDCARQAAGSSLLFLARPNAPTGNAFDLSTMHQLCRDYQGIVWIDEAYADFAADNCLDFVHKYPNVVVSRTVSKSYSLAGIRLGLACAQPPLIEQMLKVKDSYNVNALTQTLGLAALKDQSHMQTNVKRIQATRRWAADELTALGFQVLPSEANFLFARPPIPADEYAKALRAHHILIRYFPGERTGDYARVTIGTDADMQKLLQATRTILADQ
ncbi:MAG: histidinol-phosphate transaminase [Candidatus Pacebacteria bacterium]|nr:histidinol-phosphate transaminase [Candidatus Paceibacterota bacterium]